ncbi:MAG: hypothetical protein VXY17_04835, partial [Verrucomicrobiota bacterium]|nr:hypothetical protein [Verrucomicrobiota bacterium]
YWMSALQFERLGDPVIAYKTLDEMLSNSKIAELPIAAAAKIKRSSLFDALPEGALEEAATETAANNLEVSE